MTSVVIAAHNEASVIGRCLDALLADGAAGLDIVVVANGCTDDTATVAARRPGVRVLELAEASKPAALNAGDAAAQGFPRVYLDADIVLSPGSLGRLTDALTGARSDARTDSRANTRTDCGTRPGAPMAVVPRRELIVDGRPMLVRAFYAINSRLPAYRQALFGRGVIALSAAGRARFEVFPDVVADDLYLDSLFTNDEKMQVDAVSTPVATPLRTRDLVRRVARVRAGNAALSAQRAAAGTSPRPAARSSWLRDVVLRQPVLAPAGLCYAALILAAELTARRSARRGVQWGRDESSREASLP